MIMPIPSVVIPNYPTSTVQPFTYKDGLSYLERLEMLQKHINRIIIPFVNDSYNELSSGVQDEINKLISQFNDVVQQIINSSVTMQDAVMATAINNSASQTRTALNTLLNTYYTKTQADTKFATIDNLNDYYVKTQVDAKFATLDSKFATLDSKFATLDGLNNKVSPLEELVNNGRLSQSMLDARYQLKSPNVHAVFFGSSNTVDGTWTERFCSKMGYVRHNYSVGGGGFGSEGATQFIAQVAVASQDSSYDHNLVKYVFIGDLSNDVRSNNQITALAPSVFTSIRTTYPNARIIVLPLIWPNSPLNSSFVNHNRIMDRLTELQNVTLNYNVEIVEGSWSWLMDNGNWWKGGSDSGAHLNQDGYNRIADFMVRWMRNGDSSYDRKFEVSNQGAVQNLTVSAIRSGMFVTVSGNFTVPSGGIPTNTPIFAMYYGCWPLHMIMRKAFKVDGSEGGVYNIFPVGSGGPGLCRSVTAMTFGDYNFSETYRIV